MRAAQLLIPAKPTAALDCRAGPEVCQRFTELTKGKPAVLSSHRVSTVHMANRILVIGNRQFVEHRRARRAAGQGRALRRMVCAAGRWLPAGFEFPVRVRILVSPYPSGHSMTKVLRMLLALSSSAGLQGLVALREAVFESDYGYCGHCHHSRCLLCNSVHPVFSGFRIWASGYVLAPVAAGRNY
ncbi:ABC transporter ATP-binding protein [Hymenobacter terricola]|uniref:ABC transporter ATP-binding protein n=1 Tax=Hymenobacter terricola TaxID=2819236 RepID=UPI001B307F96|nr:ABC transporter ATP-binding protein [Hymenobacter terricola]